MRNKPQCVQQGFTLLEVLIAVAIIAIALITLVKVTVEEVRTTDHLQEVTQAHWVALNTIYVITTELPMHEEITRHAFSKEWLVDIQITPSPVQTVHRVTVQVKGNRNDSPLAIIHGFKTVNT